MLADSVDWSWLSRASHSDSSSVTFDTIRFCSASGGSGVTYRVTQFEDKFGCAEQLSNLRINCRPSGLNKKK